MSSLPLLITRWSKPNLENTRKTEGHYTFYMVGSVEPSPDHSRLAWSEDTTGNERYTVRVKVSGL